MVVTARLVDPAAFVGSNDLALSRDRRASARFRSDAARAGRRLQRASGQTAKQLPALQAVPARWSAQPRRPYPSGPRNTTRSRTVRAPRIALRRPTSGKTRTTSALKYPSAASSPIPFTRSPTRPTAASSHWPTCSAPGELRPSPRCSMSCLRAASAAAAHHRASLRLQAEVRQPQAGYSRNEVSRTASIMSATWSFV